MNWIRINFVSYRNTKKFHAQVYTKTFKCTYQLQLYPFDTQVSTLFVCFPFVFWNARPWQHKITVMKIFSSRFALSTSLSGFWRRQWWSSPRTTWWWSPTLFLPSISSPTGRWNSIKDSCKSSRTGITAQKECAPSSNNCFRTLTYNNASNTDAGLQMTLVFKRRLLNAILTVYLPTILILTICYATNFFKGFFFELSLLELSWVECLWFRAIVTVNLTSLLVLTTLFISVSSSLPQTAYVKMVGSICISRFFFFIPIHICISRFVFIFVSSWHPQVDIWLIFAQSIPWMEVKALHIL